MNDWKTFLDEVIEPEDVSVRGFDIKDNLDPEIWDKNNIKDYISDHLYKIAKHFIQKLDIDWKLVKDITLTGSLANYNWSSFSDIDLHIILDYKSVDENFELVKDFFRNTTMNWNRTHDITIKGHPVELYVQDSNEPHHSTGVYSIKDDRWLRTPSKYTRPIDYENVKKKAAKLMNEIDDIYEYYASKDYKMAHSEAERLKKKIRNFRQGGLEKGGQYSVENLAFKVLRRNDYLQKLSSLKILSYDKLMTINGGKDNETITVSIKKNN